ncbi:MAG: ABC transporter ATP-binding protein [Cyanobacteriota bacterium]|nr:ABC transporter ATP-binding protein [Cyanobacteriota bacterium]
MGLLGPSGCGKTTVLRLIAGFERPSRGSVRLNGREVASDGRWQPPERRGIGMIFQDYALFPHLDAWHNACFGLHGRQDTSRASWLFELLGLKGLERRFPHELSGGQRQRLAMARALAPGPAVVLMDEPFSNLDVEVRLHLRSELPELLSRCGAAGLIVTHDPEEALAICDRVTVLRDGVLHQCASPEDLVRKPATPFVARFVLQGNLLAARAQAGLVETALGSLRSEVPIDAISPDAEVMITPEDLTLTPDPDGEAWVLAREYLGREWLYQVQFAALRLRLRLPLSCHHPRGQRCRLGLRPGARALMYPDRLPLEAI